MRLRSDAFVSEWRVVHDDDPAAPLDLDCFVSSVRRESSTFAEEERDDFFSVPVVYCSARAVNRFGGGRCARDGHLTSARHVFLLSRDGREGESSSSTIAEGRRRFGAGSSEIRLAETDRSTTAISARWTCRRIRAGGRRPNGTDGKNSDRRTQRETTSICVRAIRGYSRTPSDPGFQIRTPDPFEPVWIKPCRYRRVFNCSSRVFGFGVIKYVTSYERAWTISRTRELYNQPTLMNAVMV